MNEPYFEIDSQAADLAVTQRYVLRGVGVPLTSFRAPSGSDYTLTLEDAIDSGEVILIPRGIFLVEAANLAQYTRLLGVHNAKSILKLADNSSDNLVTIDSASDISLENLTLDGNKDNQTGTNFGLYISAVTGLLLARCRVINCRQGSAKIVGSSDVRLTLSKFSNAGTMSSSGRNEVSIDSSTGVVVEGNAFVGAAITGGDNVGLIIQSGASDVVVTGNIMSNYESEVIQVLSYNAGLEDTKNRPKRILIANNIIDGTSGAAAVAVHIGENCDKVNVVANECHNAQVGIKVGQWVRDAIISGNRCDDNVTDGILALGTGYSNVTIEGNHCRNNGDNGINVNGSFSSISGIIISDNICLNNSQNGGALTGGIKINCGITAGSVSDNICSDDQTIPTQNYGLLLAGGVYSDLKVSGNVLRGNVTAPGYVNVSRSSFYSINNLEDGAPTLYNVAFSYGPIEAGAAVLQWTAEDSSFDDKTKKVVFKTTSSGAGSNGAGSVVPLFGKSLAGRDTVFLYNPTANTASGVAYIFFEGRLI